MSSKKWFDIKQATNELEAFRFKMHLLHAELAPLNPNYRKIKVQCL